MSNFELIARPQVRIRSVAAWDRLRATYDLIVEGTDDLIAYYPLDELEDASYGNYQNLVDTSEGLIASYPLDELDPIIYANYDTQVASSEDLIAFYPLNDIDEV